MQFTVDPRIWRCFPDLHLAIITIEQAHNSNENVDIAFLLREEEKRQKKLLHTTVIAEMPEIAAWHEIYRKFGTNPHRFKPSVEVLLKRVVSDQPLPYINTIVALYNYISLKYHLPMGAEDLDATVGDIELTFADGTESGKSIGGTATELCEQGEVIYRDQVGFLCRRWNWREADRTKITLDTKRAMMVIELAGGLSEGILHAAVAEAKMLLTTYTQAEVDSYYLSATASAVHLPHHQKVLQRSNAHVTAALIAQDATKSTGQRSEEYHVRVGKVARLRALGIEPWPSYKPITASCAEVISAFQDGVIQSEAVQSAGRVMAIRHHGKSIFVRLQDMSGVLQIYIREDESPEAFQLFVQCIDAGDIVWCTGVPFRTKTGEVTLRITDCTLLSKCLHPLAEKFHGITDTEKKYRQRYLDLIMSPETRTRFAARSRIIATLRSFLDARGYVEVETPMLHPLAGGAAARPFVTHHNALDEDLYLRIAPELYLKRLVVGGIERVYEINRNFRNEGVSTRHNPEFTMLELYTAHQNLEYAMNIVEELVRAAALATARSLHLAFGDHYLNFEGPWKRLSMKEAVATYASCINADLEPDKIDAIIVRHAVPVALTASYGHKLVGLFEKLVEPNLIQPTFIHSFPVELSPLAKRDFADPYFVPRFELFVGRMELSNAYHELNDPFEQAARFKEQLELHRAGDAEAHQFDADYVLALEYGLPPTVGIGIGIDRLTMLLTNTTSIKEVILFPTLKSMQK